eukprot:m.189640 g.189640  ORF g.189640 m.189640 type:complete len:704 (-) comp32381_c0_seq1:164-2275(-)
MKSTMLGWMLGWIVSCFALCVSSNESTTLPLPAFVDLAGRGLFVSNAAMDGSFSCVGSTGCDSPGFVSLVFNMTSTEQQHDFDGVIGIPDGWDYKPTRQCRFSEHSSETYDWEDYQSSVYVERRTSHHFLFWSSSHTDWYSAIHKATQSRDAVLIRKTATCSSYQLRRNIFDGTPKLADAFRSDVAKLPATSAEYNASRPLMIDFLQRYGTAVLRWAEFGGRATELTELNRTSYYELKQQQGDLESSALLNMLCRAGDQALCNPNNPNWNTYVQYRDAIVSNYSTYIPFPPNGADLGRGGPQWQAQIQARPGIISYETDNITDLFNPLLFPTDLEIIGRRLQLERYLFSEDMCTDLPQLCPNASKRQARWIDGVELPQPRGGAHTVANDDTNVYVIGGQDANTVQPFAASLRYNLDQAQWSLFSSPNVLQLESGASFTATAGGAVAKLNQFVYTTGGAINPTPFGILAQVQRFDTSANLWEAVNPLPTPLRDHCVVVVQGVLLAIGGATFTADGKSTHPVSTVFKFNAEQLVWKRMSDMPTARACMSCSVYQNTTVLVIGGLSDANTPVVVVDGYDVVTDTWLTQSQIAIPNMTTEEIPRSRHALSLTTASSSWVDWMPQIIISMMFASCNCLHPGWRRSGRRAVTSQTTLLALRLLYKGTQTYPRRSISMCLVAPRVQVHQFVVQLCLRDIKSFKCSTTTRW